MVQYRTYNIQYYNNILVRERYILWMGTNPMGKMIGREMDEIIYIKWFE